MDRLLHIFVPGPDVGEILEHLDFDVHYVDIEELCTRFNTNLILGKSRSDISKSLQTFGYNRLSKPPSKHEVLKFIKNLFGGFSVLLWMGSLFCFLAYAIKVNSNEKNPNDNLYLGMALGVVVLVTGTLSYYQEKKTSKILECYDGIVEKYTTCIRDGERLTVHVEDLTPGDIIEIKPGDVIPADVRILESKSFKVDDSSLTGESMPQVKLPECTNINPLETKNLAFYSTFAVEGAAVGMVVHTGDSTVLGRIARLSTDLKWEKTPISEEISVFIKTITLVATCVGIVFFIIAVILGYNWVDAVVFLIGTIVANVPEGLLATVTVCLALTSKTMRAKNCMVRNLETVETLGAVTVICSDKTGTLTQNKMCVSHVWIDNNMYSLNTFKGRLDSSHLKGLSSWSLLERCAILCNRAEFKDYGQGKPPIFKETVGNVSEAALLRCLEFSIRDPAAYRQKYAKVAEIPFHSISKFQLSIHQNENLPEYILVAKGAPEKILEMCSTIIVNLLEVPITDDVRMKIVRAHNNLSSLGERVMGFCDLNLSPSLYPFGFPFDTDDINFPLFNLRFLGLVSMVDPPRPGVPDAVAKCRQAGIKIVMITGDHPLTAATVAKKVGIISKGNLTAQEVADKMGVPLNEVDSSNLKAIIVHGSDLNDINPAELDKILTSYSEIVFARTSPLQKLRIVESLQKLGAVVAVTGDGVNDSPALKKADVGIAMGIAGSDVSKQAADMVLLDDNFASIVVGIEEGRLIFENLKKSIAYTLTSNIPELTPFLLYIMIGIPLALGTVAIICVDLGTDMLPAVSLAYERSELDIMKRPPRNSQKEKLVSEHLISVACGQIGMLQAFAGFLVYFVIMAEHGFLPDKLLWLRTHWDSRSINDLEDSYGQEWGYRERKILEYTCHTAFFVSIVIVQWADLIVCKTRNLSVFTQGLTNWVLNFALFFETCLACFLSYTPGMGSALRMYPLKLEWWCPAMPFFLLIIIYDECRKGAIRHLKCLTSDDFY